MDERDAFLERAKRSGGGIVPVMREVVTDADTPVAAFAKIARPPFAFLLESLVGGERWARYTFLGTEPREAWRRRACASSCFAARLTLAAAFFSVAFWRFGSK